MWTGAIVYGKARVTLSPCGFPTSDGAVSFLGKISIDLPPSDLV